MGAHNNSFLSMMTTEDYSFILELFTAGTRLGSYAALIVLFLVTQFLTTTTTWKKKIAHGAC
jgi:hypothetical protein